MPSRKPSVDDVLRKHAARIEGKMGAPEDVNYSREYVKFKSEWGKELTRYERWCKSLGNLIKLDLSEKDKKDVRKHLEVAHLDVEPWQALTFAVVVFLGVFLLGFFASLGISLVVSDSGAGLMGLVNNFPVMFFLLIGILSLFLFYFVKAYPQRLANKWRLKASSQMVPAILYVVVYMRHTPNLEKAIAFAAKHLEPPLALDFKRVFYEVEVGKFSSIKESLDNYLETWREYSPEFIEGFHLIESSLFEPSNARRVASLEKALEVVLDGVYDKMLKFTHEVRSPLTNVYMLGVVLPVLGLALLPLASALLGGLLQWYYVFVLYNLILPLVSFYLTDKIMFLRPGGYGETSLLEKNPKYKDYISSSHFNTAFVVCLPFFILGVLPLIFQFTPIPEMLGLQSDYTFAELGLGFFGEDNVFGFIDGKGPFGLGALILGMFFPLGIALFFALAYGSKTKDLIIERNKTKQLEREFNNSLFQLGNRIGNGVPPELVFGKVAQSSKGLMTEEFFKRVNYNIRQMGMGVEKAVFDPKRGAIRNFPSNLVATTMRILVEASKKGLRVAAMSLMSISQYVKNIQKITQRLKDMLAEVVSDMKSNMTFLAPLLSGVVVGLAAMITAILSKLKLSEILSGGELGVDGLENILRLFQIEDMIPPYFLQIAIGIYLIQIIFILTRTLVAVDSGEDKLERAHKTGKNLERGILLYFVVALIATLALYGLASLVLGGLFS